jgi:hypothetical protein
MLQAHLQLRLFLMGPASASWFPSCLHKGSDALDFSRVMRLSGFRPF